MFLDFFTQNRKPRKQRVSTKQPGVRTLRLESLEDRRLLSVSPTLAGTAGFSGIMTYGDSAQLIATAQDTTSGLPVTTGSIDFSNLASGQDLGTLPLVPNSNGASAALPLSSLNVGSYGIEATYIDSNAQPGGASNIFVVTVNPATPNVTVSDAGNGNDAYTGQPVVATASATGLNGVSLAAPALTYYSGTDTTAAPLSAAPVDVGTYTVVASEPAAGDYAAASNQAIFSITPATPAVTVGDAGNGSDTYTGQPIAVTASATGLNSVNLASPTLTYYSGTDTTAVPLTAAPVDVGTYTVVASLPAAGDYAAASNQATYGIDPATPAVAVSDAGNGSDIYTGQPIAVTATATGLNNVSLAAPTLTYYAGTNTAATPLTAAPVDVGTYTVVASLPAAGDYAAANDQVIFSIDPATPTVTVSDAGGVYNGQPTVVTASAGGVNGVSLASPTLTYYAGTNTTATPLTAAPVDVGTYTVVASVAAAGDYSAASSQAIFSITATSSSVHVSDAGGVYNGKPTVVTTSVTGVNGVKLSTPALSYYAGTNTSATPLAAAPVDVGTYTVVATEAAVGNYVGGSAQATFKITAATPTVKVSDAGGVYTGKPTVVTTTATGVNKVKLSTPALAYYAGTNTKATPLTTAPVDVGTYTVVASVAAAGDYGAASAHATFKISVATPTVKVSDAGGIYTGKATVVTASATGVSNTKLGTPTLTYYAGTGTKGHLLTAAPVDVGTYTVVASVAAAGDYGAASAQATFKISTATPTVKVSDAGRVYTGKPTVVSASVTGVNNINLGAPTLTYYAGTNTKCKPLTAAPVNVGTYTVVASVAAAGDYRAASAQTTFKISGATPIVKVSDAGGVYTGKATDVTASVTGVNNTELGTPALTYYAGTGTTSRPLAAAPVNVGTYTVVASVAAAGNYAAASAHTTFKITAATLTVTPNNATKVFGQAVTLSGTVSGIVDSEKLTVTYASKGASASALVEGSPYAITASVKGATVGNYVVVVAPAAVTVTPASTAVNLSITPSPASTVLTPGETLTLNAAVSAAAPSTLTVLGGTVQFFDNGVLIATEGVWNGVANTSLLLTSGQHDITAQYVANPDYDASLPSNGVSFTL